MAEHAPQPRFGADDFALLERLAAAEAPTETLARDARVAWDRAEALLHEAARGAGIQGLEVELWPWQARETLCPFVWARMKRPERRAYASHIGLFLSAGHCNLAVDLEKDLLEAGSSAESLGDVLSFYRRHAPAVLETLEDPRLRVWTDPDNVLEPAEFAEARFDDFMAANRDEAHPWPKVGYLLQRQELEAHPAEQPRKLGRWLRHLVPVYDALVASCASRRDTG